jgi:hypothetical protein
MGKIIFSHPDKWRNSDFRHLPPETKLLSLYLAEVCDLCGFIKVDFELIEFETRLSREAIDKALNELKPTYLMDKDKDGTSWIWLKGYIKSQQGNNAYNPKNGAHRHIRDALGLMNEKGMFPEAITELKWFLGGDTPGGRVSPPSGEGHGPLAGGKVKEEVKVTVEEEEKAKVQEEDFCIRRSRSKGEEGRTTDINTRCRLNEDPSKWPDARTKSKPITGEEISGVIPDSEAPF